MDAKECKDMDTERKREERRSLRFFNDGKKIQGH